MKRKLLIEALEKSGGNQSRAAELLGISRVTVWNQMKRYGVTAQKKSTAKLWYKICYYFLA
jgi:two-component system response regulator HydG